MNWLRILVVCAMVLQSGQLIGCDRKSEGGGSTNAPAGGDSPAAESKASAKLTEDDVKKFITGKEEKLATGVGSAHKSVKVEFESVQFGETRKPNKQDEIDGVRGDTVYPVRAKYKSIRTWGNGETEEKGIHYAYDFYRDEFGEWNAVLRGPVR